MVIVEAEHMCMTMRGVKKPGSKTMSYATRGSIKEDPQMQRMILEMVKE